MSFPFYQLQTHRISKCIIHPNHHGSIPDRDCVNAVGQVKDAVTRAVEDRQLAAVIMLDQTAAFDLVDHQLLLDKLELLNCSHNTIKWFKSYLEGRWISVRVDSKTSEPLPLATGG